MGEYSRVAGDSQCVQDDESSPIGRFGGKSATCREKSCTPSQDGGQASAKRRQRSSGRLAWLAHGLARGFAYGLAQTLASGVALAAQQGTTLACEDVNGCSVAQSAASFKCSARQRRPDLVAQGERARIVCLYPKRSLRRVRQSSGARMEALPQYVSHRAVMARLRGETKNGAYQGASDAGCPRAGPRR